MRWTKLKSLVESRLADSVRDRVTINATRYGRCHCGRAWISVDGEEVANFCTRAYYNKELWGLDNQKYEQSLVEYGELSRQLVHKACWEFVHDLPVDEALKSNNPILSTLAVLDGRVGKRRLRQIDPETLHPLSGALLKFRKSLEGIAN